MFKKKHSFMVLDCRLAKVLKIMDLNGIEVKEIEYFDSTSNGAVLCIHTKLLNEDWRTFRRMLFKDSQICGACGNFN